jgi:hypothetical protein
MYSMTIENNQDLLLYGLVVVLTSPLTYAMWLGMGIGGWNASCSSTESVSYPTFYAVAFQKQKRRSFPS